MLKRASVSAVQLLLLLFGAVLGTEKNVSSNDCVSEQELAEELATVKEVMKEEMERRVDQLQFQLHYWQNVTINILKDHYSSLDSDKTVVCNTDTIQKSILLNNTEKLDTVIAIIERMSSKLDSLEDSLFKISHINETVGSFLNPAHNCSHILSLHPGSSSGYYWIQSSPGYAVKVYCDMERVCGCGEGGGWMRVADIDMTRPNQTCPTGFRQIATADGKKLCGGQSINCTSTSFSTLGLQYSRVCGRVIGYQFGTPGCFGPYYHASNLVDGILLTHGSPRKHIWTFAVGSNQYRNDQYGCPCNGDYNVLIPPFVGNDYFCDSGHRYNTDPPFIYLTNAPLWDGQGCVSGSCCSFNNPPWFCKTLTTPTTDDIDLQLCKNGLNTQEGMPFGIIELYVQ